MSLLRTIASIGSVAAVTFVFWKLAPVNPSTAGFAYLLLVLGFATTWGRIEAIAASIAAVLCYNFFFLPPVGRFTIADPQNWIALFAFLVTSLVASHLSNRVRRQAAEAREHQRESDQLYAFSRAVLLTDLEQSIGSQVAQQIAQIFDAKTVVLFDANTDKTYQWGSDELPGIDGSMRQAIHNDNKVSDPVSQMDIWPVTLGGKAIGSLMAKGIKMSDNAFRSLLNLVAISLERVRTQEAANRAEIARQREEFKSTLLDSVAHEFKTPLTSIKAASTSILSDERKLNAEHQELISIIDEEADRLSLLVTDAVAMAQIDAGKIRLQKSATTMERLVNASIDSFGVRAEGRINLIDVGHEIHTVSVDGDLITVAVRQLIDNALKYSPPLSLVQIGVDADDGRVITRVADHGPGIAQRDRERIFEKFYRHPNVRNNVPGSGLGLHIAREIVRVHNGDLWVEAGDGGGSVFRIALPKVEERSA